MNSKIRVWILVALVLIVPAVAIDSNSTSIDEWRAFGRTVEQNRYYPANTSINFSSYEVYSIGIKTIPLIYNSSLYVVNSSGVYRYNLSNLSQLLESNSIGGIGYNVYFDYQGYDVLTDSGYYHGGDYYYKLDLNNVSKILNSSEGIYGGITIYNDLYSAGVFFHDLKQLDVNDFTIKNSYYIGSSSYFYPAYSGDYVYVGTNGNILFQFNSSNVSKQIANKSSDLHIRGSPVVYGDYVYISGDKRIHQLNKSNVSQVINTFSIPVIELYTVTFQAFSINSKYLYASSTSGYLVSYVYQLNSSNVSQIIANFTSNVGGFNELIATENHVYVAGNNGYLYDLNASNISQMLQNVSLGGNPVVGALVSGVLYVKNGSDLIVFRENITSVNLTISNISIQPNVTYAGQNVTINATVEGEVSSVWATIWKGIINIATVVLNFISGSLWSTTITTNDTYAGISNVTIHANDTLGREKNETIINGLNISSNDAPSITLLYPGSYAQVGDVNNVTLNFTATDDHLTTFKCDLYINSALNQTNNSVQNNTITNMNINVTLGTYTWYVKCNDTYKEGSSVTRTFYVSDTTAPLLTIQSPVNNTNYTAITINLNYVVSDNHLNKCWYKNVTGSLIDLPSCSNTTFTALQGNNNITVYANDTSNNVNSTQIFFYVDSIAPEISNVTTVNGTTSIQVMWNTDEYANGTVYWGETTALGNVTYENQYVLSHSVILTPLQESTLYYFNISSCDPYGNCAYAGGYNATTISGNQPPVVTIISPTNNERVNIKNYNLTILFNVYDDNNNLSNCTLIVDDVLNQTKDITASGNYNFNIILSGGRHSLKINCTDSAGLVGDPPIDIIVPYEKIKQILILKSGYNYSNWTATLTGDLYNLSYPSNISIDWGADLVHEWNYSGQLSDTTTAVIPYNIIESWKDNNCTSEFCYVDILFKSDTQGILNITNINLSYQRNESNYPGGITIDNITGWYNESVLNGTMTAVLDVVPINNWLMSENCSVVGGNLTTEISSFLSGVLYLSNLKFTYGSNITPIVITNATVEPPAVFPEKNFTINATVNISGAIYSVDIIQNTLYDGGFGNTDDNMSENFTVTRNSAIGRIDIYNVGNTNGTLTLSVYSYPSWTLIGSRSVSNYSAGWVMFDFTEGDRLRLRNGSTYVFEVTSNASNWNNLGYSNYDTYSSGVMFINRNPELDKDLMFRILMYDYDVESVWAVIWSGITDLWTGFLNWVVGDLWSALVTANMSWGSFVNITIYANTTTGQNATPWETNLTIYGVTYPVLNASIDPDSPLNYSPTRIYSVRVNCYTPYGVSRVEVNHDFSGEMRTYNASYDADNGTWVYAYQRINVGNYSWNARCVDINDLYNETLYYDYVVDKAVPDLRVSILPDSVSSYVDVVNLSCVSDNFETLMMLYVDGSLVTNPTIGVFPIGTYLVECSQMENNNWYEGYANATLVVVNIAPSVNLTVPVDAYIFPATTIQVSLGFNISDPDSENLLVYVYVNDVKVGNLTTNVTENSFLYNVTANSSYSWYVIVSDGNSFVVSDNRTFSVMEPSFNQLPTVNLIYPGNNSDLANTFMFINFTWEINDTDSSYVEYTLYVDGYSRCSDSVAPNDVFSCYVGPFMPNSSHVWNVSVYDDFNEVWSYDYYFTINATCTPNWVPNYTDCLPNDLSIKTYFDSNNCRNYSTIPADNGTNTSCDYCIPRFYCFAYHSCTEYGRQSCVVVSDYNDCFDKTGLDSDRYVGDMSEFERGCTYRSVLVAIPEEAGASLAMFMWYLTTPVGVLLLWLVLLAIILCIGLIIAAYIRRR